MVTGILTHDVENFDSWYEGFNGDAANREAGGIRIKGVYRGLENPNRVTIVSESDSPENYSRMFNNPAFQERIKSLGVQGKPELSMTTQVA